MNIFNAGKKLFNREATDDGRRDTGMKNVMNEREIIILPGADIYPNSHVTKGPLNARMSKFLAHLAFEAADQAFCSSLSI